jgi:hypothetical protein
MSTGPFSVFPLQGSLRNKYDALQPGPDSDPTFAEDSTYFDDLAVIDDNYASSGVVLSDMIGSPLSTDWQLQRASASPASLSFELNPSLFQDPVIDQLMENYVHNVANVLPPLPHPESPYAAVYVPNAMVGAANLLFGLSDTGSDLPSSNVAVFYALLATSAFQLRGPNGNSGSTFDVMARRFRAKALSSLQKALEAPIGTAQDRVLSRSSRSTSIIEALILAMLAFSSMDVSMLVLTVVARMPMLTSVF